MQVSVIYTCPGQHCWLHLEVTTGATAAIAIVKSGILAKFPEIDLNSQKIGIYGKICKLDTVLNDGDRVEIYRPITADPKTVKRRD